MIWGRLNICIPCVDTVMERFANSLPVIMYSEVAAKMEFWSNSVSIVELSPPPSLCGNCCLGLDVVPLEEDAKEGFRL